MGDLSYSILKDGKLQCSKNREQSAHLIAPSVQRYWTSVSLLTKVTKRTLHVDWNSKWCWTAFDLAGILYNDTFFW